MAGNMLNKAQSAATVGSLLLVASADYPHAFFF